MNPEDLLTPEIVKESIKNDFDRTDVELLSWSQSDCNANCENFFNVVKRINARCRVGSTETKEVTYIAKLNPCKTNDFFNPYRERAMTKEVFFYRELVPLLNKELKKMGSDGLRVPKYIHSSIIPEREVIILEDLKPKGFTMSKTKEMDQYHSEILAREISKVHVASEALAKSLGNTKLEEKFPLLVESWLVEESLRYGFERIMKKGLRFNLKLMNALDEFKELLPTLQGLVNQEMKVLVRELDSSKGSRVICHGDYHSNNVMFRYDEQDMPVDVMILDWQTVRVSNIGAEISYLLFSSYFGHSRIKHFSTITETYYEKRQSLLGPNPTPTLEALQNEVNNNYFGFILCFYIIPLSTCVSHPSEFFKLEEDEEEKEEETLESLRELLRSNERLNFTLTDYLSYLKSNLSNFPKLIIN